MLTRGSECMRTCFLMNFTVRGGSIAEAKWQRLHMCCGNELASVIFFLQCRAVFQSPFGTDFGHLQEIGSDDDANGHFQEMGSDDDADDDVAPQACRECI